MAQFSVKIMRPPGSVLGENQHADGIAGAAEAVHIATIYANGALDETSFELFTVI
jgi:hypothetical protein